MVEPSSGNTRTVRLQDQLKALGNRYAVEILQVLSPQTGDIIPSKGWDSLVDGVLELQRVVRPKPSKTGEKTQREAEYQKIRQRFVSGGTLYETMNKLIKVGFVVAVGARGKKNRRFTITHEGRLALSAVDGMRGPTVLDTEIQRAAKILLKHKNFTRLLPAQQKFLDEVGDVDGNLLIQMPPGSGKTFLAMLVILIRLQRGIRCLYLTPYTSLNTQVIDEYGELFEQLGYSVVRHDGTHRASLQNLERADLIVSVLESTSAAVLEGKKWTQGLGLAVIDELTELDSVVIRIEAQSLGTDRSTKLDCLIAQLKENTQLITLSSRFGETGKVAEWLKASVFRPSVRMTPDEFIVTENDDGIKIASSDGTQFSKYPLQDPLDAIFHHLGQADEKSILIVVGMRDAAEGIAKGISIQRPREISEKTISVILGPERAFPVTARLRKTLSKGVAFHHSGLDADVRERLERSIKNGLVRTVVSTTGITSGISFPFDCVIILFGTGMYFLVARSRYLQIAGRIGEYYLAQNGGNVYLVYEGPTAQFRDVETLKDTLLHRPLEPLKPGGIHPSLAASLLMRNAARGRTFTKEKAREEFLQVVQETLKGSTEKDYVGRMRKLFDSLLVWLEKKDILQEKEGKFKITREGRAAVSAGLNVIEYVQVRDKLSKVSNETSDGGLIDLLLKFSLPQSIRPRALVPSDIELRLVGLDPPHDRYMNLKKNRDEFKKQVISAWLDELGVVEAIERAEYITSQNDSISRRTIGGDIGEGDLESLVGICSTIAWNMSVYCKRVKKSVASRRLALFSRQLTHGVRIDLAASDLFDLSVPTESGILARLSRTDARTLFDNGYESINAIVRKDIDATKPGFARDRFAKNCGLEQVLAKEVYKAAIEHLRVGAEEED